MPKEPDLSEAFAMGATCSRCGKETDSFEQMETEHWYITPPADPDTEDWTDETALAECPSCGAGRDRFAR